MKENLNNQQVKYKDVVDVLSMIAGKRGLDLVLAKSQVLLVGKEIDITDQAIQKLNKVLPKISLRKNRIHN